MVTTYDLSQLESDALLANMKRLVGGSNEITAHLLAHLAEVDARGVYRELACSSLYTYCVYELRMSEDEAQRRCRAARAARQFPLLFDMLAEASIHLTGILLLAPLLTADNHVELLGRARFRTKREIERLVAEIAPQPDARASVEPLGLPTRAPGGHAAMVASLCGYVRELTPGNRPGGAPMGPVAEGIVTDCSEDVVRDSGMAEVPSQTSHPEPAPPLPAMRYKVQFTADHTYVSMLEEAWDLLQHEIPDRDLAQVQVRALHALVEQLRKRKYAATGRPRGAAGTVPAAEAVGTPRTAPAESMSQAASTDQITSISQAAATSSRHIPAAVKRAVWQRDRGRCTYADSRGERCRETSGIEFHHEHAYARGGSAAVDNIALRCRAHNGLAAEQDFGREHVERKRGAEPGQHACDTSLPEARIGSRPGKKSRLPAVTFWHNRFGMRIAACECTMGLLAKVMQRSSPFGRCAAWCAVAWLAASGCSSEHNPAVADASGACECKGRLSLTPCSELTLKADCARHARGCPESLDVWLRCSRAGQLSSPGGDGYRLVRCGDLQAVGYVIGAGDNFNWLYDNEGRLVGTYWESDTRDSRACGVIHQRCSVFTGTSESLSPAGVSGGGTDAGAGTAPLPECAKL